ncbi:MAG: dipicolinate synthase subunit DpsA [Chloroflexota bacterium]
MRIAGTTVAVVGGDAREREVISALVGAGARVQVAARPAGDVGAEWSATVGEALRGSTALVLPMPGVDAQGRIYAPLVSEPFHLRASDLAGLVAGAPIIVGVARSSLSDPAAELGHPVYELSENDELAIANSVPTAEGAVRMAMERRPVTIHGSQAVVLGLGRCGFTLARTLAALGARVTVVARKPADRARASAMAWAATDYPSAGAALQEADFVFNTVPALVLTGDRLAQTRPDCLIVDLASAPGGTDFAAASALGREALLAPGLPGKCAPVTAGRAAARVILDLLTSCR